MEKDIAVAVIGAGVVGLSTAVSIQNKNPSSSVTVFADKTEHETLSDGAGGIFRPEISIDQDQKKVFKWCKTSLQHFLDVASSEDAGVAGIQCVSGYFLSSTSKPIHQDDLLERLLPVYRQLSGKEMEMFPKQYKSGTFFTTTVTDCRYYLPWLRQKFEDHGGVVVKKHISKLSEIPGDFHVIVNCTGFGAKNLLNDRRLVPVRGQTIKVEAPWIKHFYYGDDVYVIPGLEYVTLGGVKDYGSWNTEVNPYQRQYIWDSCVKLVPSLQNARVKWDWVGLRPYRPSVCLDASIVRCDGKLLKVINNYGHGGHGVALSWGTAQEAAQLTDVLLEDSMLVSRL